MDLNEFKKMWVETNADISNRLEINENRLNQITINHSKNKLEKYMNISILGRNLALVYFGISIFFAVKVFDDLAYSVPAIMGGLAMLFSFFQHLSLKKVNYSTMNIVELQKTIENFRIHTLKFSKFDKGIVAFWIITLIPVYLKLYFHISIYSNQDYLLIFILSIVSVSFLIRLIPFDAYKKWDSELKEAESKLNELIEFEKE
ncbi:hypothetical protein [Robertkochia aurantiaca]|uniref:hypothetical protein n=1 Tax=Robertkochia aurantiaca TaxID=2873700 RepID=UPI001CCA5D48|nr:hypothetical protein [Robertkochia sp. 3YJGBD-33]